MERNSINKYATNSSNDISNSISLILSENGKNNISKKNENKAKGRDKTKCNDNRRK